MNKTSERYNTKVEIPIIVILETIFSDDNHDVETLCRWAKHYEFVDLIEKDEHKYYKLQDDYTKQSFYIWLDKEERKQYDYEDFLLDKIEEKDKEIERLNKECDTYMKIATKRGNIIEELFELKDMIYNPETREINLDVQNKISSIIVKLGGDK